jgi:PhnB protein
MQQRDEPQTFRARELSASLTVKDVAASMSWYCDVIGFVIDQKMERDGQLRGVRLKAGGVRILINQDDGVKGWDRKKGEGFSLQFTTAQSVDDIAERIESHGGALEMQPKDMPWGARIFTVRDPDGYKLVISSGVSDAKS